MTAKNEFKGRGVGQDKNGLPTDFMGYIEPFLSTEALEFNDFTPYCADSLTALETISAQLYQISKMLNEIMAHQTGMVLEAIDYEPETD